MSLNPNISTREYEKFEADAQGNTCVRTLPSVDWDSFEKSVVDTVTDQIIYKMAGVTVCTITLIYSDSTKTDLVSGARVHA